MAHAVKHLHAGPVWAFSEPQAAPQTCSNGKANQSVTQQVPVSPLFPKNRPRLDPLPFQISAL